MGKPNPKPLHVHFHENDHSPGNPPRKDSNQAMVHECLTDGGIDQSDINALMSTFNAKVENPCRILQGRSKLTKDMSLLDPTNPPIACLIGEPMEV